MAGARLSALQGDVRSGVPLVPPFAWQARDFLLCKGRALSRVPLAMHSGGICSGLDVSEHHCGTSTPQVDLPKARGSPMLAVADFRLLPGLCLGLVAS